MIFRESRLLADDSHVISYLIFVKNWEKGVAKFLVCCSRDWRFKGLGLKYSASLRTYDKLRLKVCSVLLGPRCEQQIDKTEPSLLNPVHCPKQRGFLMMPNIIQIVNKLGDFSESDFFPY